MPRMVARTEGRGNGIRTVIVNMEDISQSLNRPPDLITKFFGVELGAQTRWEEDVRRKDGVLRVCLVQQRWRPRAARDFA
jgi:translation initiation factor 2 beta subunit (eIF-2beta)/eIF-5